jgi:hypothetical protein
MGSARDRAGGLAPLAVTSTGEPAAQGLTSGSVRRSAHVALNSTDRGSQTASKSAVVELRRSV